MLGQRACLSGGGAGMNKSGRGIERLRLFWLPNPAAAREQGTSCYINLWPLQGIAIYAHWSHFVLLNQPCPSPPASDLTTSEMQTACIRAFSFDAMVHHLLTEAARCTEFGKAGQVHHHSWQNCGQQMALRLKATDAELGSRALLRQAATGYAGAPVSNPHCLRP